MTRLAHAWHRASRHLCPLLGHKEQTYPLFVLCARCDRRLDRTTPA